MIRQYAQILGVVLIVIGVLGLALGDQLLLGFLNIDFVEDIIHIVSGIFLAYAGFARRGGDVARNVVLGFGLIYLLVGILGFIRPDMFGLLPHSYTIADNLIHLLIGAANIAVGWFLTRPRTATI